MLAKIFKRGLIAIAPLAATIALIQWLFTTLEGIFSVPIKAVIGDQYYFRGMGIIVALFFICLIGSIINNWIVQKLSSYAELLLKKIPLVKTLYNSIGELMSYFRSKEKQNQGGVVLIDILGVKLVGLVTRESFKELPAGMGGDDDIAVFLPLSYQIGGHTVIVSRSKVKRIDMTVEEGMRFCVTAGVLNQNKKPVEEIAP
ncbi:MAG: DUF502 domain-containing protein [Chlamydiae bacterium]|nr:DUF502 domain-containing protein [Chlamydiota bacterium]